MFDKFGELGSAAEINELALNMRNEGDTDGIKALAAENGINEDMAMLFCEKEIDFVCDELSAAIGKIDVECKDLKPKELVADWVEYIKGACLEWDEMAIAVRKSGKRIKDCIAELLKWSFKNCYAVDSEICKAAGVSATVKMGIPGMARAKQIIRDYYMGG